MDRAIDAPVHEDNIVDGPNAIEKRYLKEQIELLGKLTSHDASKIGMLPIESKHVSNHLEKQFSHILTNNDRFNGLKGSTKMLKISSLFKYQSRICNVQRNDDVKHKSMKL